MKPTVLITRKIPEIATDLLIPHVTIEQGTQDGPMDRAALLDRVRHVAAIIPCLTERIDQQVFAAAGPQLKVVANFAVGFDNIDLDAARAHGVTVTNAPAPEVTTAVAEHTMALILAVARQLVAGDQLTRAGEFHDWLPLGFLGMGLRGKTLGIVGCGRIGSAVMRIAVKGFGMEGLYVNLHRDESLEAECDVTHHELDTVLKRADVISLHVPLTRTTHHLIGHRELGLVTPTAILINTSRGPVIDQPALVHALETKRIAGAGLDVFENEHLVPAALRHRTNVTLTPHIGSATLEARMAMAKLAAENILAVLAGKPALNPVKG